jgi:CheY-like chemotaxis protein
MNQPSPTPVETKSKPQILCVDDEPQILQGIALHLRKKYEVLQATSGIGALKIIEGTTPAVIISDMRMPGMDGAQLLAQVHAKIPRTSRILLTGYSDMSAAASAVNDGQIFRFLVKPCPPPALLAAVDAAFEHHRVLEAEKILLEQTLRGAVRALADVLALLDPRGFGRSALVKDIALALAHATGCDLAWQLEVAATFAHVGTASLPSSTAERVARAARLTPEENAMVERLPAMVEKIVRTIPRLDDVAAIVAGLEQPWSEAPRGARILRLAMDAAAVEASGTDPRDAVEVLRLRASRYEPALLDALAQLRGAGASLVAVVQPSQLALGMVLVDDLKGLGGLLIVQRGTEVTAPLLERVRNFPPGFVTGTLRVRAP